MRGCWCLLRQPSGAGGQLAMALGCVLLSLPIDAHVCSSAVARCKSRGRGPQIISSEPARSQVPLQPHPALGSLAWLHLCHLHYSAVAVRSILLCRFFSSLIQRAAKMHRRLRGGSMSMLLVTPGVPASGESVQYAVLTCYAWRGLLVVRASGCMPMGGRTRRAQERWGGKQLVCSMQLGWSVANHAAGHASCSALAWLHAATLRT